MNKMGMGIAAVLLTCACGDSATSSGVTQDLSAPVDGQIPTDMQVAIDAAEAIDSVPSPDQTMATPDDLSVTRDASIAPDFSLSADFAVSVDSSIPIDATRIDLVTGPDLFDKCASVTCTPDSCHTGGVCDPRTGTCSFTSKADGTSCKSTNLCASGTIIEPPSNTTITIGGFDSSRGGGGSLVSGAFLVNFRNRLTSADFPGVTFNLTGAATLTQSYLATLDILVITCATSDTSAITPLSQQEQAVVTAFILGGGRFLIVSDNSTFSGGAEPANNSLLATIGMTSGGVTFNGDVPITAVDNKSPLVTGRSGSWSSVHTNYAGTWANTGKTRVVANVNGDSASPALGQFNIGDLGGSSARGVVIADVNALSDYGGFNIVMTNNIVDYLIPTVQQVIGTSQANTCQSGVCIAGAATYCPPIDACHESGTCNPANGACATGAIVLDGTPCANGGTCTAGVCH